MEIHLEQINRNLSKIRRCLFADDVLNKDIDFTHKFIPPYTKANNISDIKLIIIGQDPTIRELESRKDINTTLNLNKKGSLRSFVNHICTELSFDIEKDIYATNLYKCFFNFPPADDERILYRHFKYWADFLIDELNVFGDSTVISLGEPLIKQLLHCKNKEVKYYWDYIGNSQSGKNFKFINPKDNYLNRQLFPIAHQPTCNRNKFYNEYLSYYLDFIKQNIQRK
ncbi:MAG TPA: hypothetical protein DDZ96_14925 [Porphyromonadaceae bacterium]|jgi:uracil-DNA glycosylase|nr:hypothetical protein [Porphyromonadaceae bacterium]HBX19270.1 hypothetical protein [Porphyromonadaceae bacterium]HCM20455.1 hypothetical protein [Porphyromonadaceae bacterium]